jgi:hypothetical protein
MMLPTKMNSLRVVIVFNVCLAHGATLTSLLLAGRVAGRRGEPGGASVGIESLADPRADLAAGLARVAG